MIITNLMLTVMIYASTLTLALSVLKLGVLFCVPKLYNMNEVTIEHEHRFLNWYWYGVAFSTVLLWFGYFTESRVVFAIAGVYIMLSTTVIALMYIVIGSVKMFEKLWFNIQMKRHDLKRRHNLR